MGGDIQIRLHLAWDEFRLFLRPPEEKRIKCFLKNIASVVPLTSHFLHFLTDTVVVTNAGLLSRGLWDKPQLAGIAQDVNPKPNKRRRGKALVQNAVRGCL